MKDGLILQAWDPDRYARNARFVAELGEPLIELLDPRPGQRILDLGCGDGVLTERLVARGLEVVAVDASPAQVAAARARGLNASVMDGQALEFEGTFDGVFSNAALHWMRDPDAVIAGVWRALRPGGAFVAEMGGAGNVAKVVAALDAAMARCGTEAEGANPWYFPAPEDYSRRLALQGFSVEIMSHFPRPTQLPGALDGWLETFAESFVSRIPEVDRGGFAAAVAEALAPELRDSDGVWWIDYVRLRFRARKPAGR